eukprot:904715-Prorocentrum_minimum.AAC.4
MTSSASGTKVATPNCGAPGGCSSLSISSAARTPTRNLVNRRAVGTPTCLSLMGLFRIRAWQIAR